jgi:hypothetical protein
MIGKRCDQCGKAFTAKREHGIFCSTLCRVRYARWVEKCDREQKVCLQCGRSLDDRRSDAKFCGWECRAKAWREKKLEADPLFGVMGGV